MVPRRASARRARARHALVLNQSDGAHSLLDIAQEIRVPFCDTMRGGGRARGRGLLAPARARSARRHLPEKRGMGEMKVVLFCGGFGTRLREHSDTIRSPGQHR